MAGPVFVLQQLPYLPTGGAPHACRTHLRSDKLQGHSLGNVVRMQPESYCRGESRHAQSPPFLLETLPLMMTGDPGANVCSTFFLAPQPPNIEITLLPLTFTWLPFSSWEFVDLHTSLQL